MPAGARAGGGSGEAPPERGTRHEVAAATVVTVTPAAVRGLGRIKAGIAQWA